MRPPKVWSGTVGMAAMVTALSFNGVRAAEAQACACNDFSVFVTLGGNLCAGSDGPNGCDADHFPSEDLEIIDASPAMVFMNSRASASPTVAWELRASSAGVTLTDLLSAGAAPLTIEPATPDETLHLDSTGFVGMGTTTPAHKLHLLDSTQVRIRMQADVGAGADYNELYVGGTGLWISDSLNAAAPTFPVKITHGAPTDSLVLEGASGEIGLGTSAPAAAVHIRRSNGPAQLLVEDTGPAQTRRLLDLQNNGGVRMRLVDNSTGTVWAYQNIASEFRLNAGGAGDPFVLDTAGNLTIGGTLTQNSDRHTKTSIEPVRAEDVLARVAGLPISTWALEGDARATRHLGPMAQDFSAAFGLGADDRHLAPVDMAGVALAAIQALERQVRGRDERIAALEAQNADLAARLAALEQALDGSRPVSVAGH